MNHDAAIMDTDVPMDRVQLDSIDSRDIPYSMFPDADLR